MKGLDQPRKEIQDMIRSALLPLLLSSLLSCGSGVDGNADQPAAPQGSNPATSPASPASFAITNARVFDGARFLPRATVVVVEGRIQAVGPDVSPPAGAEVINAGGATLLPGFIDAHTHTFDGAMLERALVFGVTTELDMFTLPDAARNLKRETPPGTPLRADLRSAGILATAPGGHGTQFGLKIPTLTTPEEAQAFVDARVAEGSDYIKIVSEDGSLYGSTLGALDRPTIAALITAAHGKQKLAVVHVSLQSRAREALESGADGLVHLFADSAPEPAFVKLAAGRKAFVIPTLTVLESTTGTPSGRSLTEDIRLKPFLRPEEVRGLLTSFPRGAGKSVLQHALDTVRQLKAAGVPILAGTDAPNPGTTHGASMHRELELLVSAGLSPTEALAAATSVPARVFGLEDRGRIAPGLRADLVLIAGDPASDITATRNIVRVWKAGQLVERTPVAVEAARPAGPLPAGGKVSDFDDGKLTAGFGAGWGPSTDAMAGGESTVEHAVVEGGAEGSRHALEIAGTIRPGFQFPWAGMIFFPGAQPMSPVDLSAAKELVFWSKGDGRDYQVMLFAASRGPAPAVQSFTAGPEWQRHAIPLSAFGLDGKDLSGIFFGGGPAQGDFRFRIDSVGLSAGK
jgi:imidazolonepropionase-like amidohydrolase